jgi:hypothetical protein
VLDELCEFPPHGVDAASSSARSERSLMRAMAPTFAAGGCDDRRPAFGICSTLGTKPTFGVN